MKLLVTALEASANLHLEQVLKEFENIELLGIFDPKFGKPYLSSENFGVMGFLDIIPKISLAKKAIKELAKQSQNADKILLIDSPAFNIPFAKAIKEINPKAKIIYYILPQVWAWKKKRVAKIEQYCDTLASILPFEQSFYNKASFIGHPLLDELNLEQNAKLKTHIAFLPGSRKAEIQALMPIFKEVAKHINKPKFLCIPSFFTKEQIKTYYGDVGEFEVIKNTQEALKKSDFAFICSGTATLEATLLQTPFALCYKAKKLDFLIAKTFVKLPYIGLANLIMHFNNKEQIHEELLQDEVNALNLLKIYQNFDKENFQVKAKWVKNYLKFGSSQNLANLIKS